jgi:hypothetical protein
MRKTLIVNAGDRFNRLTVIKQVQSTIGPKSKKPYRKFLFKCDCGNEKEILLRSVVQNMTQSCGCLLSETAREKCKNDKMRVRHGHNHKNNVSPTYITWGSMKQRCRNPNAPDYKNYGGRGITICDRWLEPKGIGFINFLIDMGERPVGTSIDRIDVNGNYEPSNCRWATMEQQNNNRRNNKKMNA